jgi:hypothetical protein
MITLLERFIEWLYTPITFTIYHQIVILGLMLIVLQLKTDDNK